MRKTKLEKGITLIALIITIVVLLILAVVSIGAIKNSKIISHSQNSADEFTIAQEKEQLQLALTEWQLQKNTQGNTKTFKATIEEALIGKGAEVGQADQENGPLTVTFTKTEHVYKLAEDGTIKELSESEGTDLEKYILGPELSGRKNFFSIYNGEGGFLDDPNTLPNASELIEEKNSIMLDTQSYIWYIKYNNELYKFKVAFITSNEGETNLITDANYGVQKIKIDTENTRVGKKVFYNSKDEELDYWIIIYDDEVNGLQMVHNGTVANHGDGKLHLGSESFEDAVASYNGAIKTLNEACNSVVPTNDKIKNVRCIGTNPKSENENSVIYNTSANLTKWLENAGYSNTNQMIIAEDLNVMSDLERLMKLEILVAKDGDNTYKYWLGSRVTIFEGEYEIGLYSVSDKGNISDDGILLNVSETECIGKERSNFLRPVICMDYETELTQDSNGNYILN